MCTLYIQYSNKIKSVKTNKSIPQWIVNICAWLPVCIWDLKYEIEKKKLTMHNGATIVCEIFWVDNMKDEILFFLENNNYSMFFSKYFNNNKK